MIVIISLATYSGLKYYVIMLEIKQDGYVTILTL
jgi:hypothetical protein